MTTKICEKCGLGYYGTSNSKYCLKCRKTTRYGKYYEENKEQILKRKKRYKKLHPKKQKENDHRYYLKNKEKYIKNAREWSKKHPRKSKQMQKKSMKKFRTEKREQFNQSIMNNYYDNKEKWLERNYINRHRKEFLELLPKKCTRCGKRPIKIISHLTYKVPKRKMCPTREEVKKYLIKYSKLLLPFCSIKCCSKYLMKWGKR